MKFLGKLAGVVAKIGSALLLGTPLYSGNPKAEAVVGRIDDILTKIGEYVSLAEIIGQNVTAPLPGAEKLKGVTPAVAQLIMRTSLVAGYELDQALFAQGCEKIASGVADVLNSRKGDPQTVKPQDL